MLSDDDKRIQTSVQYEGFMFENLEFRHPDLQIITDMSFPEDNVQNYLFVWPLAQQHKLIKDQDISYSLIWTPTQPLR